MARRAGEKDTTKNSCSKELKILKSGFAGLRIVVEI